MRPVIRYIKLSSKYIALSSYAKYRCKINVIIVVSLSIKFTEINIRQNLHQLFALSEAFVVLTDVIYLVEFTALYARIKSGRDG